MKRIVAILLAALMLFVLLQGSSFLSHNQANALSEAQGTHVGGIINSDTTWTLQNSPYVLDQCVQVADGVTLTIQPGVVVEGNNHSIEVWGAIRVNGQADQQVEVNKTRIVTGSTGETALIDIQYASIDGGGIYSPTGHSGKGSLILKDSVIKNIDNHNLMYLWYPSADCYIERNIFYNSAGISTGIDGSNIYIRNNVFLKQTTPYAVENWADYSGQVIVRYNSFLSNDRIALKLPSGYSNVAMIADHNYWNTTDTSVIDSMIYDKNDDLGCAGYINYTPILSEPDPNTPSLDNLKFTISASASSGGTITPSGNVTVAYDAYQTFAIAPNEGYHIKNVLVDNSPVGALLAYTFNHINSNHTIEAQFEITAPPSPPQNLQANASASSIVLSWDASTQGTYPIAGYAIYRGTTAGGESSTPIDTVSASVTTYTDTNVTQGTTYYYYVKAFDNQDPPNYSAPSNEVSATVSSPLTITTTSLPDGTVGVSYSATLQATGGTGTYTWSITGNLPDGLSLSSSTGVISGTPTTANTYNFTVQVSDGTQTATKNLSIKINSNTTSFTLHLPTNWSIISVPFDTDPSLLTSNANIQYLFYWDGSFWQIPTTLHPGIGYLVYNTSPSEIDINLTGTPTPSPFTENATGNWQVIGNPFTSPATLTSTSTIQYLFYWDGSFWQIADPNNLQPGVGYLILTSSPGTLTFTKNP